MKPNVFRSHGDDIIQQQQAVTCDSGQLGNQGADMLKLRLIADQSAGGSA